MELPVGMHGRVQNGGTLVCIAALGGHKECIEVLAGLGGDVNEPVTVSVEGEPQSAVAGARGEACATC